MKQIGFALVTFAIYTAIFNWQVAAVLCVGIGFHEYSHLWAARRLGLSTKGFYLIPFLGGLALVTERPKTRSDQAFIALMGPIGGGALALVTAGAYVLTDIPVLGTAAAWMLYVNLFNLLPLSILDGGQIMDTITHSINRTLGFVCQAASTAIAIVFLWHFSPVLSIFVVLMGGPPVVREYKNWNNYRHGRDYLVDENYLHPMKPQSMKNVAFTVAAWFGTAGVLLLLKVYLESVRNVHLMDLFVR